MMKVSVEIEELTLDQLNAVSGGDHDPGSRSGGGGGTGTGPGTGGGNGHGGRLWAGGDDTGTTGSLA